MIPGRMILLITLLLILTNIFTSVTSQSPTTKSLTSISTWIITCILFVYGALMEYGCILAYIHVTCSSSVGQRENVRKIINRLDSICLFFTITTFTVFNLTFWNIVSFH